MQLFCIFKGVKGFKKVYNYAWRLKNMIQEIAWKRVHIIEFFEEFGLKPTIKAFEISKSTIYNWLKKFKESGNKVEALNNKSKAPKNRRESKVSIKVIKYIRELREKYPRLGKEKIKPLLDEYCEREGLEKISVSTIGRIIKRYNLYNLKYCDNYKERSKTKIQKNRLPKWYKVKEVGEVVQIDSITEYFKENVKLYIITGIDITSRFGFAYCFKNLSSRSGEEFMKRFKYVMPVKIKSVKTDNGKEFMKYFERYLNEKGIEHYWSYPRKPQQNAYVERFNRTIEEEWLAYQDLTRPIEEINKSLIEYLIFYNTKRIHKGIQNKTPVDFIIKNSNFSNMLWTYTIC